MPITYHKTPDRSDRRAVVKLIEKEREAERIAHEKRQANSFTHIQKVKDLRGFGLQAPVIGAQDADNLARLDKARKMLLGDRYMNNMQEILPLLFNLMGKPYSIADHFPFEPFYSTRLCRNLVYKTGRQTSKCCRADSKFNCLYDEYGRRYRLADVEPGQSVQSFDVTTFRSRIGRVLGRYDNPVKTCYYIRTRRGVEMELAGTHPLYTYNGYVPVDELDIGDRIVHVRTGGKFGRKRVDERRIRITAYMLGDGSFRSNYAFTAGRKTQAIAEMRSLLKDYREYRCRGKANDLRVNRDHVLRGWAKEDGLHGKLSHEKYIPDWVFLLSKTNTRTFIDRLWATDGMVRRRGKKADISYVSTSRELIYSLKSLLAKFHIPVSIKERTGAYKKPDGRRVECRQYWLLRVETRAGWQTFLEEFIVPDKPGFELPDVEPNNNRYTAPIEISELIADLAGECRGKNRQRAEVEALGMHGLRRKPKHPPGQKKLQQFLTFFRKHRPEHPRLAEFEKYVHGDADWDEIVEIRCVGDHKCADIEVEDTHCYLLDGILSHNSTNQACQGVLLSNLIPYFNTLFVTPQFELIRRFSTNYVQPFIMESPIKSYFLDSSCSNNVLQRTFRNRSIMYFSFALLDCDRTRGLNCGRICFDESSKYDIMVETARGPVQIQHLRPGDPVLSFDINGKIEHDQVKTHSYHGVRNCYRIELSDGSFIESTSESFVATTAGWKRVSTIIEDLDAAANSDAARHDAGRRQHDGDEDRPRQSQLPKQPRLEAAQVQLPKIPGITQVREQSSLESTERRLGGICQSLPDQELSRTAPYRVLVSPRGKETGNPDVARSAGLGGGRVVVHGRRESSKPQAGDVPHTGVFGAGGVPAGRLAVGEGRPLLARVGAESTQSGKNLLVDSLLGRGDLQLDSSDRPVPVPGDAVQIQTAETSPHRDLQLVRPGVPADRAAAPLRRLDQSTVLSGAGLYSSAHAGRLSAVQPGKSGVDQPEVLGALLLRSREEPGIPQTKNSGVAGQKPRAAQCAATQTAGDRACEPRTATTALRDLPEVFRNENPSKGQVLLAGLQGGSPKEHAGPLSLEAADIVSITCTGQHPVYDIETEKNNTFFAGGVAVHNCQDLDPSFIPIIAETMSASSWGISQYTGTPKTLDGTLENLWIDSSMAEWLIRCEHCKRDNVPSLEHDLEAMLGPVALARKVSEREPGVVCAKCGRPLNLRKGTWHHLQPEKRANFSGYHVPQMIMPMHYANPEKWAILQGKRIGLGRTSKNVFYNECCGESYDLGSKLLTVTDLRRAAILNENTLEAAKAVSDQYVRRVLSVDWGGGGEDEISFTTVACLGWNADSTIDVIYGWRSLTPNDPVREAVTILQLMKELRCTHLVDDFGGAGALRETLMMQAGLPENLVVPVAYQRVTAGPMMQFKPFNQNTGKRAHHLLDKTRSLQYTAELIKSVHVKFFRYDYKNPDEAGLLHDFLSLIEDKLDSRMAQGLSTIIRNKQAGPDDFAHAVNMGVCALCHAADHWPDIARLYNIEYDRSVLNTLSPVGDVNWEDWP